MLRVISRPRTVPAERMALLNAELLSTCSSIPGSCGCAGAGIASMSPEASTPPKPPGSSALGGGASLAASRS